MAEDLSSSSNRELVRLLRDQLTLRAKEQLSGSTLEETKAWRGRMWTLINELDLRLIPSDESGAPRRLYDERGRGRLRS